jgi:hypothetical protein
MCHYSKEFVSTFEKIDSFRKGAEFIEFWTKVKKNKPSELVSDLPKVLESAYNLRASPENIQQSMSILL